MTRRMLAGALATALTLLAPAAAQAGAHITWTDQRITVTTDGAGDVISLSTRSYVIEEETVVLPAFPTDGSITYSPEASQTQSGCSDQIDAGYVVCDPTASVLLRAAAATTPSRSTRSRRSSTRSP